MAPPAKKATTLSTARTAGVAAPGSAQSRAEREALATQRLEAALVALAARDRARFGRILGRR